MIKDKIAKAKEKALDKGIHSMIKSLKKCGQTDNQIMGMLTAVWKQKGFTPEQVKKAKKEATKYLK